VTTAARPSLNPGIPPAKEHARFPNALSVLGRRPTPNGNASGNNLRPVRVREKRCARSRAGGPQRRQIFDRSPARPKPRAARALPAGLGGYGRRMLFPYSDLDILFLLGDKESAGITAAHLGIFANLWDIGFRVSSAGRTLKS